MNELEALRSVASGKAKVDEKDEISGVDVGWILNKNVSESKTLSHPRRKTRLNVFLTKQWQRDCPVTEHSCWFHFRQKSRAWSYDRNPQHRVHKPPLRSFKCWSCWQTDLWHCDSWLLIADSSDIGNVAVAWPELLGFTWFTTQTTILLFLYVFNFTSFN